MHFLIAAKTQTARPSASLLEEQLAGLAGECCIVLAGGWGGAARRLGTSQIDSWCSRTHLHGISGISGLHRLSNSLIYTRYVSIQMRHVSMAFCFVFFVFVVVVVLRFNQHRAAYTYPGLHIKFKNSYNN